YISLDLFWALVNYRFSGTVLVREYQQKLDRQFSDLDRQSIIASYLKLSLASSILFKLFIVIIALCHLAFVIFVLDLTQRGILSYWQLLELTVFVWLFDLLIYNALALMLIILVYVIVMMLIFRHKT